MEALFSHLNLLIWLDGMLGYAEDADTLIATLKTVSPSLVVRKV